MILRVFVSWGMSFDYKGMWVPKSSGPPDSAGASLRKSVPQRLKPRGEQSVCSTAEAVPLTKPIWIEGLEVVTWKQFLAATCE
jgi:hypothetical protein